MEIELSRPAGGKRRDSAGLYLKVSQNRNREPSKSTQSPYTCLREKPTSVEAGLFHDPKKLFLVHFTVSIPICFVNHFLQLLISEVFPQLGGHAL